MSDFTTEELFRNSGLITLFGLEEDNSKGRDFFQMLSKRKKDNVIQKFKIHKNDTGSAEVQIAILTEEIKLLIKHLKKHPKDFSSRRGLVQKVNHRRRLLKFLLRDNLKSYEKLTKALKLKTKITVSEESVEEDIVKEKQVEEETQGQKEQDEEVKI